MAERAQAIAYSYRRRADDVATPRRVRARAAAISMAMLRTVVLSACATMVHSHAILLKPAMRMNPGWPSVSKTGQYRPLGTPPWSDTQHYYPYACNFAGGHNCGGALCYKHDTIGDCTPSNLGNPPDPCFGDLPGTRVVTKGPATTDPLPNNFFMPFTNASEARDPLTEQPWIDSGLEPTEWCAGDEVTTNTAIQRDHNGIWRWEYQQNDGSGRLTETKFQEQNATEWRWFSNDPQTRYFKADAKTSIAHDECFNYTTGASQGPGSWTEMIPQCKTPNNWNGEANISWGGGNRGTGNSPETYTASIWTLPPDIEPGKYVFRWIWYGGVSMDGTVLDTKFGAGPEPALFANCVDVIVKPKGTCTRER
eukprot:COSAG02_NODE_6001_length_3882_cov_5.986783_1_plen_366_part_00